MTTRTDAPPGRATAADVAAALGRTAFTPREVATSIGRTYRFVLRLIHRGELHAIPAGPHYVIPAAALDEFLASAAAQDGCLAST